jgi:hypothetical protein
LVSCTNKSDGQSIIPIVDLAKEHFNIVVSKNFKGFKEVYKGTDKETSNISTVFDRMNELLSLGDVFLPPDSLIWVDTVDVTVDNKNQKVIQCLIPVSPQKNSPIPEGYFFLYYNLNQELIGFNYNTFRIAQGEPPFPRVDNMVFEDNSFSKMSVMFEGGFKNPLLFKRITYKPIEIKRNEKLQVLLNLLGKVQLIPTEGTFGHKKFFGNPVMNIVNINLKDGQNFSIFSIIENQPNYLEAADENNRFVVYHYDVLNSCYQYYIDKTDNSELVALIKELGSKSITMTRENRYYLENPMDQVR